MVSIRLLAEQMLLGCPAYAGYTSLPLYIPGEISRYKLTFTSPVGVFTSENNPGALAAAQMLQGSYPELRLTSVPPAAVRVVLGLSGSISSAAQLEATVMLLYLNDQTYLGDAGERLGTELLAAQRAGRRILTPTLTLTLALALALALALTLTLTLTLPLPLTPGVPAEASLVSAGPRSSSSS